MRHLTPDELIDAVEGALRNDRAAHLERCAECRARRLALGSTLDEVGHLGVPEPSPLFWDQFSARVGAAVAAAGPHAPGRRWFEWPVLAPIGLVAALVLLIALSLPGALRDSAPESSRLVDPAEERFAAMLEEHDAFDLDAIVDAGVLASPGTADGAVLLLSSAEQQELIRLLIEEGQ